MLKLEKKIRLKKLNVGWMKRSDEQIKKTNTYV